MSLLLLAHLLTLAVMMGLAIAAAVGDIKTYQIPNAISLALFALYPVHVLTAPYAVSPLPALAVMAIVLAIGFGLFSLRLMGGGDVKLLTALSLFAGPRLVLDMMLITAIAGGAIAVVMLKHQARYALAAALDHVGSQSLRNAVLTDSIPYGLAIAVGAICLALQLAAMAADASP